MRRSKPLHLYEEVLLLALRNDKGTMAGGVMFEQAAGGAILAELILENRVRVLTEGRSSYALVQDSAPMHDAVLDECLQMIVRATRRKKLATWVQKFGGIKQLKHRAAASLRDKGVLREDESPVLLIFSRRVYPELDPAYERDIVSRLDQAIHNDGEVDARTTVLVALGHHAGLLKANMDRKRLKARRDRIESVITGDAVGRATRHAIEAVQAAIMVAVIMPAITPR